VELENGFTPIKELIYSIRTLKNYLTTIKLHKLNIDVCGVKTDSIIVKKKFKNVVLKMFDFSDKIGCFKLEIHHGLPGELINKIKLNDIIVDKLDPIVHNISDEYDKNEINNVIVKHNIAILGALPGVGKTTTSINYKCNKKLFISPYNKLCQELHRKKFDAITLHMLLGYGHNNDVNTKMKSI